MKVNNTSDSQAPDSGNGDEFRLAIRVYYEDTDAGGVVYHANYLCFMERARTEWLRALGYEQDELRRQGLLFAVRRASIEFIRPARFNELLEVSVEIKNYRGASVDIGQMIFNQAGETICTADIRIACVDAENLRPRQIPKTMFPELSHVG